VTLSANLKTKGRQRVTAPAAIIEKLGDPLSEPYTTP
jgi:hypothetical protein